MLNPMLRLSGLPLNHYFNPQSIFPPVPSVPNVPSLTGAPLLGTGTTAAQTLQTHIGSLSEVPKPEAVHSPVIVPNRVTSPQTSSASSTSPSPQLPSTNHSSESRIPMKEAQSSVKLLQDKSEGLQESISPRKRNREMTPILDPLEPLEKISRLEHLTSSIGGSKINSKPVTYPVASSSNLQPMKTEVISVPSSSPLPQNPTTKPIVSLPIVQSATSLADQSEVGTNMADKSNESLPIESANSVKVPTPKEVQTKDNSSSSEDFSSSEENLEDKNENIKVFKNGVEMTTWHCDVCKCIFLDQVSKITLCIKVIMMSFPELSTLHNSLSGVTSNTAPR